MILGDVVLVNVGAAAPRLARLETSYVDEDSDQLECSVCFLRTFAELSAAHPNVQVFEGTTLRSPFGFSCSIS